MQQVQQAAPIFIGILIGVLLFANGAAPWMLVCILGLIVVIGFALRDFAYGQLGVAPVLAVRLWQAEILVPIALIAFSTYVSTYISFNVSTWLANLPPYVVDQDTLKANDKEISKILIGALTTLIGALWLDNAKDPTGKLWPSGQIKAVLLPTFKGHVEALNDIGNAAGAEELYRALTDNIDGDFQGWEYAVTVKRARKIEKFIR